MSCPKLKNLSDASAAAAEQHKAAQDIKNLDRERAELARGHKDLTAAVERGKLEMEKLLETHRETEAQVQGELRER